MEKVQAFSGNEDVQLLLCDLSSLAQIRACAEEIHRRYEAVDVLVNNAGVMLRRRVVTADGFEKTFAVNHLAYFLLTHLLLDLLKNAAAARIVNVASVAHKGVSLDFENLQSERYPAGGFDVYKRSKLANILFTYELARHLDGTNVTANCLHPGLVASRFNHNNGFLMRLGMYFMRPAMISSAEGARTSVYLATSAEVDGVTGKYFVNEREVRSSRQSYDRDAARRLWEASDRMTGLASSLSEHPDSP